MMNYPKKEGKNGPIFQIAEGLYVALTEYGTWQLVFKRGRERKKKTFGPGEEELSRAIKAAELLAARLGLNLEKAEDLTFGILAQSWLEANASRWRPATIERYQCIVRDFLRPLHHLILSDVDRAQVKKLLSDLLKIRSPGTVETVHAVISGIFNEAIDLGYTDRNPAYGLLKRVLPSKRSRAQSQPDPFTRQDLERFLAAAWKKLPEPLALVLETMAMTGMRLGEVLAMRREFLDVHNCQYHVTETTRNGRFGPPKCGSRLVDLDDVLVAKLAERIKALRKEALAQGRQAEYLFPDFTQRIVQGAMSRACIAARLRCRSPHDLRHTYATLLLMDHHSPAYVQKQLGHHSISMTVDNYGHWLPGEGKKDLGGTLRRTSGTASPRSPRIKPCGLPGKMLGLPGTGAGTD
jgi:integrase